MTVLWHSEPDGPELQRSCQCCGRAVLRGTGMLMRNGQVVADYWYDWSEGHLGLFAIAIRWGAPGEERIVECSCTCDAEGTKLKIVDPAFSWGDSKVIGAVLSRDRALADPHYPEYFDLFDAVIQFEPRLAPRVREREAAV